MVIGYRRRAVTRTSGHILVDVGVDCDYLTPMTHELDAIGLLCPLPVLKARKRMQALDTGDLLIVRTDDPAAVIDMPHYCHEAGHALVDQAEDGAVMIWTLRKA